jgi:hypothetical protein
MMKIRYYVHKVSLLIILIASFIFSFCQSLPSARVTVDKNRILLGEQINMHLEAKFPAANPISFFDIDSIDHFEILNRQKIDTQDSRSEITLSQTLVLTSFDSGHWVIPSFKISTSKILSTDTIPIDVSFSSPFDPKQPYHDIKDVKDVERTKKQQTPWWWYAAGGFVLLLIIVVIYLITRKKKPIVKAVDIDPFEEARLQLSKLQKEELNSKLFYTRLVDIFRWYLQRRANMISFEKTTPDLIYQLKSLQLPEEMYTRLIQTLRLSDFVKFAKYEPAEQDKKDSFNIISAAVEETEKKFKQQKTENAG